MSVRRRFAAVFAVLSLIIGVSVISVISVGIASACAGPVGPAAPTSLAATPGNGSASITFTPGSSLCLTITNYKYSTDDGSTWTAFSPAVTTSPVTISGLTNGTNYSVKLRAFAGVDGAASAAVSVTPRTVPGAPTSVDVTPGDGSVSVAFTAGADGGAAITNYRYSTDSGSTWTAFSPAVTTSPVTIGGLSNGTIYGVELRAVNSAGDGATSSAVSVTPRTVPDAPTSLVATPGSGSASIAFTAGADGGAAITNHEYQLNGAGSWVALSPADAVSPVTVPGLSNGTAYTVKVRAVNSAGPGAASLAASSFTPRTVPSAPTVVSATPGDGSVSVAFTAGADGGAAITKFQYRVGTGPWVDAGTTSPITISPMVNYVTYSIQLRAVNAAGVGVPSVVGVRPKLAGPTIGVAYSSGRSGVQVGFAFARPTGSTLVGFTVWAYAKGTDDVVSSCQVAVSSRSCYIGSLVSGTQYDIRVKAFFTVRGDAKVHDTLRSSARRVRVNN